MRAMKLFRYSKLSNYQKLYCTETSFSELLLLFSIISSSFGEIVNLNCIFFTEFNQYTCLISNVVVADNENQQFVIGGNHTAGRSDSDVERLQIMFSQTPFIITQLFETFSNVQVLTIESSHLTRIQPRAFENAKELTSVVIVGNAIREVPARVFGSSTRLRLIDMDSNQINHVDENAFEGLASLQLLYLDQNKIYKLSSDVFRPLVSLRTLFLQDNQLDSLDGKIFANNRQLFQVDIERNRINRVGRSFLDGLNNLFLLTMTGNLCVSKFWSISGSTTLDSVRADLKTCFANFE